MTRINQLMTAFVTTAAITLGRRPPWPSRMAPRSLSSAAKPDDPFWSKVKKGADDAGLVAKATGGSVTWLGPQNYDNLGPDAAKLIRTALSQHPDAIVGPDWVPEADGRRL